MELHLELNSQVSFIFTDLCGFCMVDVPPSVPGPEDVPKPGQAPEGTTQQCTVLDGNIVEPARGAAV